METEISGCCSNKYWDRVRNANGNKEYPSNMGEKWSDEEEVSLLEELENDVEIDIIAQKHNRTVGGIESRCREIAYKMYVKNISIEEIIQKTKLDSDSIKQTIEKRQKIKQVKEIKEKNNSKKQIDEIEPSFHYIELQNDVNKIKNDINEIKSTLGELLEMMKAVYDFEDG